MRRVSSFFALVTQCADVRRYHGGCASSVTGATSGIGRAVALAFASRGDRLVLVGRNEERGAEVMRRCSEAGGEAVFVALDVTASRSPERMVDEAVRRFGRLDVV